MGAERDPLATTEDAVLGGRLLLRQPKRGHRVGHDAILLAAMTGGRAGELAVDLGAGVGAAGLALAARIAGLNVVLVEIDEMLCTLAAENAQLNRMDARVKAIVADAGDATAIGLAAGSADRVLMNPPFNDPVRQNSSPDPGRRLAHVGGPSLLQNWTRTAAWLLKPQGVLTLIWRADGLAEVLSALADDFGGLGVLPVLPRDGRPPIRVLVSAKKGAPSKPNLAKRTDYPGLVLNDAHGRPTAAAQAVLRGGQSLPLAEL
ncbi:MAG TPA: methyltransferase [Pseudolabrys sp.]